MRQFLGNYIDKKRVHLTDICYAADVLDVQRTLVGHYKTAFYSPLPVVQVLHLKNP